MHSKILSVFFLLLSISMISCNPKTQDQPEELPAEKTEENITPKDDLRKAPDWAKNANIYEVNLRQYTTEGTIRAFMAHLPRLQEMGVDILWFMPVHEISKNKRKGTLGSYYAVTDYKSINSEYGTKEDFDAMVAEIHKLGMKIILDWVPNHTGWDSKWITDNPEWYTKNAKGEITDPIDKDGKSWDWTDVADLNYDNKDMRAAMIDALVYWVKDHDIDGYRCDVAFEVPDDFWDEAILAIQKEKNVFMLAEAEHPPHRNSGNFHMNYGWEFHHLTNAIAKGEKNANDIDTYFIEDVKKHKKGYPMMFSTNHDENSWNGTVFERYGDGHKTFAVLVSTIAGMPLVYSGQEAPVRKRLEFFEKDAIDWNNFEYADFYKTLLQLKKRNKALWNGEHGGQHTRIKSGKNSDKVYAFTREKDGDKILVIVNLSDSNQKAHLHHKGEYTEVFSGEKTNFDGHGNLALGPWDYKVYSSN
ncbi:MAG: alpha-amylase family glycosyl hydrolase [Bacteroidota bacterium]